MSKRTIGIPVAIVALIAAGSFSLRADQVPLAQVPDAVQRAIKQHSQGQNLEHVERETRDGQVVYEAEFKKDGLNRRIKFGADGSVLPARDLVGSVTSRFERKPSMLVSDLPLAVQKTVKEQQAGRLIADIDRETWNGQSIYEVEFKEKGVNSRLHIASDGSIVVDKDKKGHLGAQLSETPAAVQATVKRIAGSAPVADVDRETKDGKIVYDVEIQQDGLNRHLQIAESGALLHDSKMDNDRERVRSVERDALGSVVTLEQLPLSVQNTIKAQGNLGTLKPIKREANDGRVQYDVEFEKDGKNTRLTIGEDGTIVKDNR
jgi:uncharacterized membrane protein YkoI